MNGYSFESGLSLCRMLAQSLTDRPITAALPSPDEVTAFAKAHGLVTLIGSVLPLGDEFAMLRDAAKAAAFRQIKADAAQISVSRRLSDSGICHIPLKGAQLQRFYPKTAVRSAADIDIYVSHRQRQEAAAVLLNAGFALCRQTTRELSFCKPPYYHVELHVSMDGFSKKQQAILASLAENAKPTDGCCCELCDSDCYIYIVFHLYKHFVTAGAGVRMFLDIFMMRQRATLDDGYIHRTLRELGIDRFADTVQEVNRVLFEGDAPADDIAKVIAFVFHSRAYGVQSAHLALATVARPATKRSRFSQFIEAHCFDSYSMTQRYPLLKKYRWLYPFCCFHRVINGLIFNNTVLKETADHERLSQNHRDALTQIMTIAGVL